MGGSITTGLRVVYGVVVCGRAAGPVMGVEVDVIVPEQQGWGLQGER